MKLFCFLATGIISCQLLHAQVYVNKDTTKKGKEIFTAVEQVPEFPGGYEAFSKYLSKNLKYPAVARLIGINGRLVMSFVVEKDGHVADATPRNCIGAGCEAEAVRLLEASPVWKPGIQDGKPVRVQYSIPISFTVGNGQQTTDLRDLRSSPYGFVFKIKDSLYTIDEAQKILGKRFPADQIEVAEPFYNYNKIEKFEMPDKKEVYLLIFKKP